MVLRIFQVLLLLKLVGLEGAESVFFVVHRADDGARVYWMSSLPPGGGEVKLKGLFVCALFG